MLFRSVLTTQRHGKSPRTCGSQGTRGGGCHLRSGGNGRAGPRHSRAGRLDRRAARIRSGVDIVARFGGEAFEVVLPEADKASALRAAESLRAEVAAMRVPANDAGALLSVTVSIGVATWTPGQPVDFETQVDRADHALYQAKGTGRNAVYCADAAQGQAGAPGG